MADRADYLARTLLSRMRSLEGVLLDDAAPDESESAQRRAELVEKILAVEAGVVDGPTVQMVLAAMPAIDIEQPIVDRDRDDFAAFLRRQVWAS
jgi:hypothetical protein